MTPTVAKAVVVCMFIFILLTLSFIGVAQEQFPASFVDFYFESKYAIADLDWNFDSMLIAFSDGNEDVTIINVETGEIDLQLNQIEDGILAGESIAWNSTQNHLLIVNNLTRLWDYADNTLLDSFDFPMSEDYVPVGNADWHPTQDQFAILLRGCEEGTPDRPGARVETWDVATATSIQVAGCIWNGFGVVKWNPQGTQLAINGFSVFTEEGFVEFEEIEIWDVNARERILTISDLRDPWGLSWRPTGNMIAFTTHIGIDQIMQILDVSDGEIVSQTVVHDVGWSPDGNMLASAGRDGRLFILDIASLLSSLR